MPVICLLALTCFSQAANLELVFNETSFSTNTSGTFRLTGFIPATGYGQGGFYIGSDYYADYYSFSSDYLLSFTTPPSAPFEFYLQAISASGTAVRDSTTYTIKSIPGIGLNIFGGSGVGQVQVYLDPGLNPNFGPEAYLPDNTQGTFLVDITGQFVASAYANGSSPASQGVAIGNLASTNTSPYVEQTLAITVSAPVPEPITLSLLSLATLPLLLRRRKAS
ncbi:MAG: hypothetical protein ACKODZ_09260 [Verrucomicrobiota bacterium]